MTNDRDEKESPSLKPQPAVIRFLRDPSKPLPLRVGIVVLFMLVIFTLLPGKNRKDRPEPSHDSSFPTGPAGLADSDGRNDQMRAAAEEAKKRQEEERQQAARPASSESAVSPSAAPTQQEKAEPDETDSFDTAELRPASTPAPAPVEAGSGPFAALAVSMPRPVALITAPDGTVWVAHRYGLVSYKQGQPAEQKVVMDRHTYDQEYDDELPAISGLGMDPDNILWLGFMTGQIMKYERYEWKVVSRGQDVIKNAVVAIGRTNKKVFAAGRGLFEYNALFQRFVPDPEFRDRILNCFLLSKSGVLYLGGTGGLWAYNQESSSWTSVWKALDQRQSVRTIVEDADGSLLLGTKAGIVRVTDKGFVTERLLPEDEVRELALEPGGRLWVGTGKHGLKYWNGSAWYIAGAAQGLGRRVSALMLHPNGRLWVGLEGKGVLSAPIEEARSWIMQFPEQTEPEEKPQQFDTLCEAARQALRLPAISGDISAEEIDGRAFVFIRGVLACPKDIGYRRIDGKIVLVRGRSMTVFTGNRRDELKLPEGIPVEKTRNVLIDSKDRIWLGTELDGLLMYDQGAWRVFGQEEELLGNPITSMLEENGNLWIGTSPKFDENEKRYLLANLHLLTDQGWFHYSPKQGLIFNNTLSLSLMSDNTLVVGSMAGLSLINKQGQVTNYGKDQGLEPYYAFSAAPDRKDRLWVAHQFFGDGITVLGEKKVHRITTAEGLFSEKVSLVAHDRAGRVWLVAPNGLTQLYPYGLLARMKKSKDIDERRVIPRDMFRE